MALTPTSSTEKKSISEDEFKLEVKIASLPTIEKGWLSDKLYKYEGFWFARPFLDRVMQANETFKLRPNDVILATYQKSGTTWFTALLVTLLNRNQYDFDNNSNNHPLHTHSPLDFVRWIELNYPDSSDMNPSSLVKTHIPYSLLPECIKPTNACPVIYVCRNPLDVFVSALNFYNLIRVKALLSPLTLEEGFEMFCQGQFDSGPYWDHVLGYWNASIEKPNQILFLRYEDMKAQPITTMKKLASFVGCPFTTEEEQNGVIEKIIDFCSFENLSNIQINKDDENERDDHPGFSVTNKSFFRKGKVGDYVNFLTDEMIQRLKEIISIKFKDTGLDLFA